MAETIGYIQCDCDELVFFYIHSANLIDIWRFNDRGWYIKISQKVPQLHNSIKILTDFHKPFID